MSISRSRLPLSAGPATWLLAILLLMLTLSAVLAYQAWDTARSHRRATEGALRDYAGFASWELRRRLESSVSNSLTTAMLPVRLGILDVRLAPGPGLPGFAAMTERSLPGCPCPEAVHDFFILHSPGGEVELHDSRFPAPFRQWLASDLLPEIHTAMERLPEAAPPLSTAPETGSMVVIRQAFRRDQMLLAYARVPFDPAAAIVYAPGPLQGDGRRVYGFAVNVPAFVSPLIGNVIEGAALLPASLTDLADNAEVLSVTVWSVRGDTLFRTGGAFAPGTEVIDTIRIEIDTLVARVAVRPEVAEQLIIGGLPRSRLPLLLGSLALTLGLIMVGVVQLRRQQELFRLRSDFISGVSHELRTPLAQIRLFSDLLASGRLEEAQRRRSVRIINEESQRLTYLVENVLRFARSERRTDRIATVPVEVSALLHEIVEGFAPLARAREATIRTEVEDGIRATLDPDALRQIVLNLLDNAAKYGPRRQQITVGAAVEGSGLRIRVEDEGPGIPPEERERIWEPYRRLARDLETATGGSGIGLAVVRELAELHGGRAFVMDRAGGGSCFVVLLPGAERADARRDDAGSHAETERGRQSEPRRGVREARA